MAEKKMIVAVDDSNVILKSLETFLGAEYTFRGFTNGTRAFGFLKLMVPDLILLDIDMPDVDGFQLLKMIRGENGLKSLPILFLTSNNDRQHVQKAFLGGANDYCIKPIEPEIVKTKIHKLLNEEN